MQSKNFHLYESLISAFKTAREIVVSTQEAVNQAREKSGVSLMDDDTEEVEALVKRADAARELETLCWNAAQQVTKVAQDYSYVSE